MQDSEKPSTITVPEHRIIYDKNKPGVISRLIASIQALVSQKESRNQQRESFEARSQVTELFHGATSVMLWIDISTGEPRISRAELDQLLENAYQELEQYHPGFIEKEKFINGCKEKMRRFADWLEATSGRAFFQGSEDAVFSAVNHTRKITS